jgi:hypothetical protein
MDVVDTAVRNTQSTLKRYLSIKSTYVKYAYEVKQIACGRADSITKSPVRSYCAAEDRARESETSKGERKHLQQECL